MDSSDYVRLMARIEIGGPDECWRWRGCRGSMLPQIQVKGKNYRAPRLLLEWKLKRPLRAGCRVAHSCANTLCCNPAHIIEYSPEEALANRLWASVGKAGADDCWEWMGEPFDQPERYGRMTFRDKNYSTHRVAWEVTNGPIPLGLLVLHRCDNRKCCNPAHLFLGTHKDNEADKYAKERGVKGKRHYYHTHPEKRRRGQQNNRALLDEAKVLAIRARYAAGGVTMARIGQDYGISEPTVRQVVTGFTWTHVGGPLADVSTPRGPVLEAERAEIREAYASGSKRMEALMREHRLGFPALKLILVGIDSPPWRSAPPPIRRGEDSPRAKLTAAQVAAIRERVAAGERQVDLCVEYGVSLGTIHNIVHYRSWKEEGAR